MMNLRQYKKLLFASVLIILLINFFLFFQYALIDTCYSPPTTRSNYPTHPSKIPSSIFHIVLPPASVNDNNVGILLSSWRRLNPGFKIEVYDNADMMLKYVKDHMDDRVYQVYSSLKKPVLKSDMFRYIRLYVDGGVYADTDVRCVRPVEMWHNGVENVSVIIGPEVHDHDFVQFLQWTMASAPGHPLWKMAIDMIVEKAEMSDKRKMTEKDILEWTGPVMFSKAVRLYLKEYFGVESVADVMTKERIGDGMRVGDVFLLPYLGFGNRELASRMTKEDREKVRVQHFFFSSWREYNQGWRGFFVPIKRRFDVVSNLWHRC